MGRGTEKVPPFQITLSGAADDYRHQVRTVPVLGRTRGPPRQARGDVRHAAVGQRFGERSWGGIPAFYQRGIWIEQWGNGTSRSDANVAGQGSADDQHGRTWAGVEHSERSSREGAFRVQLEP